MANLKEKLDNNIDEEDYSPDQSPDDENAKLVLIATGDFSFEDVTINSPGESIFSPVPLKGKQQVLEMTKPNIQFAKGHSKIRATKFLKDKVNRKENSQPLGPD